MSRMTDAVTKQSRGSGLGRIRGFLRRLLVRGVYSFVESLAVTFSGVGVVRTLAVQCFFVTVVHGLRYIVSMSLLSGAGAFVLTYALVFYKTKVDMKDASNLLTFAPSQKGSGSWQMLTELANAYQKTFDAFPELQVTKLTAMREEAFEELLLRFMTLITLHAKTRVCPICNSEEVDYPEEADEAIVEDLRRWLPYAEAPYYDMTTETGIEEWLAERGYQLVLAKVAAEQNAPVHCVGVNRDKKELVVLIRGTVGIADAVTDMTVTPEQWGDSHHMVHRGIGLSADHLYQRLRDVCCMFDAAGYNVVVVGHSLGAGAAALLAWLLRRDGLERVRAYAYATPACASIAIADECREYVTSVVMRDDLVPRLAPRSMMQLEKSLLEVEWDKMEEAAGEWGPFGSWVCSSARSKADKRGGDAVESAHTQEHEDDGGRAAAERLLDGTGAVKDADAVERMVPVVPGKIVYLHPLHHEAVDDVPTPEAAEERVAERDGDGGGNGTDPECMQFRHTLIVPGHPTLTTIRLVKQGVDDHLLDAYRLGLGMDSKTKDHPEKNLEAAS